MKVLKFGAVWCNGCIVMKPRWQKIETIYKNNGCTLDTEFFDFDNEDPKVQETLDKYKIKDDQGKLPVFVFLDNQGQEVERLTGEIEEEKLMDVIDSRLENDGIESPRKKIREEAKQKSWWRKILPF
jgi:thiol-disulfide isomerase/thioredoxin